MKTVNFSKFKQGILSDLLLSAYSQNPDIVSHYKSDWRKFDRFVYDNLQFMDTNGFISIQNNQPIGFMSWDSRLFPESVEIGHNCIIHDLQGQGFGGMQLRKGIDIICENKPRSLIVKTGNNDFFLPAQKMYESVGFSKEEIFAQNNSVVSEIIVYRVKL